MFPYSHELALAVGAGLAEACWTVPTGALLFCGSKMAGSWADDGGDMRLRSDAETSVATVILARMFCLPEFRSVWHEYYAVTVASINFLMVPSWISRGTGRNLVQRSLYFLF